MAAHIAASRGDVAELRRLYSGSRNRPPKTDGAAQETPLHAAARARQGDALGFLLAHSGIDVQSRSALGETAAHTAAMQGWVDGMSLLTEHDPSRRTLVVNDQDLQGLTPLHLAVTKRHEDLVGWMLKNFTAAQLKLGERGSLALHFAAASGNLSILKSLVQHGGQECVNVQDDNGSTAAYFAAQEGQVEAVKYLVSHCNANPRARSDDGMQLIHAATQNGHFEVVKWLTARVGRSVLQEVTSDGATPIHFAAAGGHAEILKWFLNSQNGAALARIKDGSGWTPCHDAVDYRRLMCLRILLKNGADLFAVDKDGASPYSLALQQEDNEVKMFVLEHIRMNRLSPPDTAAMQSSDKKSVYENVSHPSIPSSLKRGTTLENFNRKKDEVRTLTSLSQEIEAAQNEVMAHRLSTALEAAALVSSQDTRHRPDRRRSVSEMSTDGVPMEGLRRRTSGDTLAAGIAAAHSPAVSPPALPETLEQAAAVDVSAEHESTVTKGIALPHNSDIIFVNAKPEEPAPMSPEARHEPEGQEHGHSLREMDTWFSSKGEREKDDIADADTKPADRPVDRTRPSKHSVNSWHSSSGDSTLPKNAARGKGRRASTNRMAGAIPRFQYMPVYQPVLTPYGYMLTQSLMPVPVYPQHPTRRKRRSSQTDGSNRQSKPTPTLEDVGENEELQVADTLPRKGSAQNYEGRKGSQSHRLRHSSHTYENPYAMGYSSSIFPAVEQEEQDGASVLQRLFRRDTRRASNRSTKSDGYWGYIPPKSVKRNSRRTRSESSWNNAVEDPHHTPGSTIHALAVASSVIALSVVAAVPKNQRYSPGEQTDRYDYRLGEPVSLDDVRDPVKRMEMEAEAAGISSNDDVNNRVSPTKLKVERQPSKLGRKISFRKGTGSTAELDDVSARPSRAWEFNYRMEKQASENWGQPSTGGDGLLEGILADLSNERKETPKLDKTTGKEKTEKSAGDATATGTPTDNSVQRSNTGRNSLMGIFPKEKKKSAQTASAFSAPDEEIDLTMFEPASAKKSPETGAPPPLPGTTALSDFKHSTPKDVTHVRETDGGSSFGSSSTIPGKTRAHIDRLVKGDVRALLADSGDELDTVSQVSKATTTTSTLVGRTSAKERPASGDPFGLSELAVALQLASEPEYWKESLAFNDDVDPHSKPEFKSSAAVETSAAGAVVFDESILFSVKKNSSPSQPSQGTLSSPKETVSPEVQTTEKDAAKDVMSTVAALASFADDEPSSPVRTTIANAPSPPTRVASMPQSQLGKKNVKPASTVSVDKPSTSGGKASRALWQQVSNKSAPAPSMAKKAVQTGIRQQVKAQEKTAEEATKIMGKHLQKQPKEEEGMSELEKILNRRRQKINDQD